MNRWAERSAAVSKLGLPAGLLWAIANYYATSQSGGTFDVQGVLTHLLGPLLAGGFVSSLGGPTSAIATAWGGRRGETMSILESLKTLIEQFQAKGIPSSLSLTVSWGEDTYALEWQKRGAT